MSAGLEPAQTILKPSEFSSAGLGPRRLYGDTGAGSDGPGPGQGVVGVGTPSGHLGGVWWPPGLLRSLLSDFQQSSSICEMGI